VCFRYSHWGATYWVWEESPGFVSYSMQFSGKKAGL